MRPVDLSRGQQLFEQHLVLTSFARACVTEVVAKFDAPVVATHFDPFGERSQQFEVEGVMLDMIRPVVAAAVIAKIREVEALAAEIGLAIPPFTEPTTQGD